MEQDPHRILVVDPDPWFTGRLKATLAPQGYDIEAAEGIIRAAQRMRYVSFDCLIVDEDLPEMKGHDAVPVLKAISPQVPIIVTAARNSLAVESSVRRQDVFFYHVKTFDMHELQMAVRDALRKVGKGPGGRLAAPGNAQPSAE